MSYRRIRATLPLMILVLGAAAFVSNGLRLLTPDFVDTDISGILYNADLINHGGLPYRDSLEHKSPLSFFVSALALTVLGRDLLLFKLVFYLWLLCGAVAVGTAAKWLYTPAGRRSARASAYAASGVYLLSASQFEYNYSGFMAPAYALSFALAVLGARQRRLSPWVLSGMAYAFAFLLKAFAITLAPLIVLMTWQARREQAQHKTLSAWAGGVALGFLPIVAVYAWHGALGDLIFGTFPVEHAVRYFEVMILPIPWWWFVLAVIWEAYETFPLAVALVLAAGVAWWLERGRLPGHKRRGLLAIPLAFLVVSLLGVSLGGTRFYRHYLIQYLPALAILAAYPGLWRCLSAMMAPPSVRHRIGLVLIALAVAPQILHLALAQPLGYHFNDIQTSSRAAAAYIREVTKPEQTILAWGCDAWPVYYWSERAAPSVVYKELGAVTTLNNQSTFFSGETEHFRDAEPARRLLTDIKRQPPEIVVVGRNYGRPSMEAPYPGPLGEFTALREFLETNYAPDRMFGDLLILRMSTLVNNQEQVAQ